MSWNCIFEFFYCRCMFDLFFEFSECVTNIAPPLNLTPHHHCFLSCHVFPPLLPVTFSFSHHSSPHSLLLSSLLLSIFPRFPTPPFPLPIWLLSSPVTRSRWGTRERKREKLDGRREVRRKKVVKEGKSGGRKQRRNRRW